MKAFLVFTAIPFIQVLVASQDVQRVGNYNRSCVHGYPVKLGWKYDPGSSSLTAIQWTYRDANTVLTYFQSIGPPGTPGADFTGRANFYTDTETNAGLEMTNVKYPDDSSEYNIVVVVGSGPIPETEEHKSNLIVHETVSDIEPMVYINNRGIIIISSLPSVIDVPPNFSVKADVSHISPLNPIEAHIRLVVSGQSLECQGTNVSFECDKTINLSASDGAEQILSIYYTYGCYSQIYKTTLKIVDFPTFVTEPFTTGSSSTRFSVANVSETEASSSSTSSGTSRLSVISAETSVTSSATQVTAVSGADPDLEPWQWGLVALGCLIVWK